MVSCYWAAFAVDGYLLRANLTGRLIFNEIGSILVWVGILILIIGLIGIIISLVKTRSQSKEKNIAQISEIANLQNQTKQGPVDLNKVKTQIIKGRLTTGSTKLDELLHGGIPQRFSVALTTPLSDEGNALIKNFIETGAKNNQTTYFITVDPSIGIDIARKFPANFFMFIANPQTEFRIKKADNVFVTNGIENLTEINIALTKALRQLDPTQKGPRRICLNIVSDVLLQHGSIITRKWLSELITTFKAKEFTIMATIDPQMHPSTDVHALLSIFDGEINIRERETIKELKRFLKIKRMRNRKYLKNEVELTED